jgi:hypothetical protein
MVEVVILCFSFNPIVRYEKAKLFFEDGHLIETYLIVHAGGILK